MNKPTLHRALTVPAFLAAMLACWIASSLVADHITARAVSEAVRTQRQLSGAAVDNMVQLIASDLAMARAIPETMAEVPLVRDALARSRNYAGKRKPGEPERRAALLATPPLAAVNGFLRAAQGFSGLDNIWLTDPQGLCVAASNATARDSFVGVDVSQRNYLRRALLGAVQEAYGVGRRTGESGVYIAAPVYQDGLLVGAIVAKVGLARLRHWVATPGAFVADENGVIIMAHDSTLEGYRLAGARIASMDPMQRAETYQRVAFPELALAPLARTREPAARWVPPSLAARLVVLGRASTPSLLETRSGLNSDWSAYLVDPLVSWQALIERHRNVQLLVFTLLAGTALLAYLIFASYRRERRHHRATRDLAAQLRASNARLFAEAREDALTGTLSRRYFLDLLQKEMAAALAARAPMSLAIADLDHFKRINDDFGHAVGDRALEHFAATCRLALRAGDAVGRLGGEEFGILLVDTALPEATAIVERLRGQLGVSHGLPLPDALAIRASFGLTALEPDDTPERLLARADRALYRAKSAGRDRTFVLALADEPASSSPLDSANA